MIARLVEAILQPVLRLAGELMARLFLAPFAALFGASQPQPAADVTDESAQPEEERLLED